MAGYSNDGGGTLGSTNAVDTGLLRDAAASAVPDYSGVLGKLVAEKEQAAKLALVSRAHDQLDFEEAQRKADLATLKARRAEADMHARMLQDPKYMEAVTAGYTQKIAEANRASNAVAAGEFEVEKEASGLGLDPQAYVIDGKVNHAALAADTQKLKTRNAFIAQGWPADQAKQYTGPTSQEANNTPAPDETPAPAEGSSLSDTPAPAATAAPAAAPAGPALSSAPAPGAAETTTATGITLPPGIAPNAPKSYDETLNAARMQVAIANKIPPFSVTQKQLEDAIGITTTKEIFVDPKTQDSYEAEVTKDRAGNIYRTSTPILHQRSATQQTIDTEAAKDYQDYTQNRGAARDESDIATLDEAIKILKDPMTMGASGPVVQAIDKIFPAWVRSALTTDKSLKVPQLVKGVMISHLKELFGARVSNQEMVGLLDSVFNLGVDEKTNAGFVEIKRDQLLRAAEEKRESMIYFGEHGTLAGFKSKSLDAKPASAATGSSTSTSSATATLGDTKYIGNNAYKLTKNESTGKNDWVRQ